MGVLKNGVGRPSNETIRKRNILKVVCIVLVLIIIGLIGYILNDKGIINVKKDNKKVAENNTKKETVNVDDAKKELDRFVKFYYYEVIETKMDDGYKADLAISKRKPQQKNYTCKEMFDAGIVKDDDECYDDGESIIDFYEYETVNKEYIKLFGDELPKKDITNGLIHYTYSKTKNAFFYTSENVGDRPPDEINKIYDAYKENNELHIIFSTIPFYEEYNDEGKVDKLVAYINDEELADIITNDIKFDKNTNEDELFRKYKITNEDELFEKYKDKLPKYEFVLTKKDGSYIYKSFSEVK